MNTARLGKSTFHCEERSDVYLADIILHYSRKARLLCVLNQLILTDVMQYSLRHTKTKFTRKTQ